MQISMSAASLAPVVAFAMARRREQEPDFTIQKFATLAGVTRTWASLVLSGKQKAGKDFAAIIERELGIPAKFFTDECEQAEESLSTSNSDQN